jgi:vacuolar-type H+-ATPase subunit H
MDVLKEIQQSEAHAREIERQYAEQAKSLASGTAGEFSRLRAEREAALEAELATLRKKLDADLEREKKAAADRTRSELDRLAAAVEARGPSAASIILRKAGLSA